MKHWEEHPTPVEGCYACKLSSVRFNGLYSFRLHREAGTTGMGQFKENVETFRKNKGYDPVTEHRWI